MMPPGVAVLMYHSVSRLDGSPLRDLAVPPDTLRDHLGALRDAGYRLVGQSEALDLLDGGCADPLVALTFDDGYVDFVDSAVGILAQFGAKATLYMSVGHAGQAAGWLGDQASAFGPIMPMSQLSEVDAAGIEIGNHSLIHHPLDVLPAAQLDREIGDSTKALNDLLGRQVRSFAYPHGYNSAKVRATVAKYGHTNACEVGRRLYQPGSDRFAISRLQPTPDHSGAALLEMVRGRGSQLIPRLKRMAQPGWRLTRGVALRAFNRRLT
jgi:peptidoglycan/xylan/chitin deacetylase (PgdA/CDA1 family)